MGLSPTPHTEGYARYLVVFLALETLGGSGHLVILCRATQQHRKYISSARSQKSGKRVEDEVSKDLHIRFELSSRWAKPRFP